MTIDWILLLCAIGLLWLPYPMPESLHVRLTSNPPARPRPATVKGMAKVWTNWVALLLAAAAGFLLANKIFPDPVASGQTGTGMAVAATATGTGSGGTNSLAPTPGSNSTDSAGERNPGAETNQAGAAGPTNPPPPLEDPEAREYETKAAALGVQTRQRGLTLKILAIKAAVVGVGILVQMIRSKLEINLLAPAFYLSGLSLFFYGPISGGFAVAVAWMFALALNNPALVLPVAAVALGAAGYLIQEASIFTLALNVAALLAPNFIALLYQKPLILVSQERPSLG